MTFRPKHSKWDQNLYNPRRDDKHPSHRKFVAFSAFLAIFVDVFFNKISCYFCDFCEIFGLLEGLLCLFSKKLPPLAKKLVRSTCSKSIGAIKFLVTSAFFFFLRIFGLIKGLFTFLLYKSELLPNLLFLLSSRYFLACFFRCNGKFVLLLRFLRNWNLRRFRGPSLPCFFKQKYAIFDSVSFLLQWKILFTFAIFAKLATFSRFIFAFFLYHCFKVVVLGFQFSISVIKFS